MRVFTPGIFILAFILFLVGTDLRAQTYWMNHAGGTTIDEGMDVAVDGAGKTYVTGYFTTAASFGSTTLSSSGVDDIFLACVGTNGLYTWAVKAGGINSDRALSIKADANGNTFITGYYYGTATFGSFNITSAGAQDIFIAKYNSAGTCLWAKSAGGAGSDIGHGIAIDNSGNVVVTGEFAGTSSFGSTNLISQGGSTDVFTTKLDGSGNFLWAKKGSASLTDRGIDVDCDANGNIYITGQFSDTITFDVVHTNNMLNAIFTVKYDPNGNEQWFRKVGGGSVNISNSIACNQNNEIYVVGDFQGTITFFGSTNTNLSATYANRIFIAKYDASGGLTWSVAESSDSPLNVRSVSANNTNVFIGGDFKCTFNSYSDRYGTGSYNSTGYWDIFEGKYTTGAGAWVRGQQFGGKKDQICNGVAVDGTGNPHVAGSYDVSIITPVSNLFYGYPLFAAYNMTYNNDVCSSGGHCGDTYYNAFAQAASAGNTDIFVGNPVDPNRSNYDFYYHTGTGCNDEFVGVNVNMYGLDYGFGGDTISACQYAQLIAATQTSVFSPSAGIGPDFSYQWSNNQTTYYNTVTSTGYYSVVITSADGCYTSEDTAYVIIHPPPPPPVISDNVVVNTNATNPQPIIVCADSVILTGGNVGNGDYYWGGPAFAPGVDSSLSVTVDSSGTYTFTYIDQYGCTSSNSVQVELDSPLPPIIPDMVLINDTDLNDSVTFCQGEQMAFFPYDSLSNPNANFVCIDNLLCVLWSITPNNNASIFDSTTCSPLPTTQATIDSTGWYTVNETIILASACGNDTFYYSHQYYFEVLPTPPPGSLTLAITGQNLLCPGDSSMLVVTGGINYIWSTTETNDTIWASLPGSYSVSSSQTVTNAYGCSTTYGGSASIIVAFKPQPTVTMLPSDGIICPGDSVELITTGNGNFVWQGPNGPVGGNSNTLWVSSPGAYSCIVTDADSCQLLSNSVTIQQYNTPLLIASPSQVLCPGDSVVISLTTNSATVTWDPPLSGTSTSQVITQPGTYGCNVQACNIPTHVTITILPTTVTANISALSDTTICEGDSVLLGANSGPYTYLWQPGSFNSQQVWVYSTGMYQLTVSDTGGCGAHDSTFVNFTPNTVTTPVVVDTMVCVGMPASLSALGTPAFNWYEDPAGANFLFTGNPYVTAPIYGDTTFYVQTYDGVCRGPLAAVSIHPEECPPLTPNVFTPNGDGTNDSWSLIRPYAKDIRVEIYDRWGVLVYVYSDLNGSWNGTYMGNGKEVTDGVYYYIGYITDQNDVMSNETGFIQLIRQGPK
ncbi:MAG TPA: gliding motility-associated C-terminal domain-containing protein [Bacteroidia bacterium]|jgi:gliding motility-associated-like protein|nr:gliding motility-associated C-terminal domain-containing protein [Bacteroidia bacterium]